MSKKEKLHTKRFEDDNGVYCKSSDYYYEDWELSQEILDAIEGNEAISVDSKKNVQIEVEKGFVILWGTVLSHQDKLAMRNIASAFAGMNRVQNQLEIIEDSD